MRATAEQGCPAELLCFAPGEALELARLVEDEQAWRAEVTARCGEVPPGRGEDARHYGGGARP